MDWTVDLHCPPAVPTHPFRGIPGIRLHNETWPTQLELGSYILIFIFTNQSEHFCSDQSDQLRQCYLDQSNQQIWIPYLHKNWPIKDHFLSISRLPLCLNGVHLPLNQRLCFPSLQIVHFHKVSPLLYPKLGYPNHIRLVIANIC